MIVAMSVELVALTAERNRMQSAVDAAALAGARQASLSFSGASVTNYAVRFANQQIADLVPRLKVNFTAAQSANNTVEVVGIANRDSFFGNLVPPGGFTIQVRAIADALNQQPLCVLGLRDRNSESAIWVGNNSLIQASNCLVHSNGTIRSSGLGKVSAGAISARSRAFGSGFSPGVNSGALAITNPFLTRQISAKKACKNGEGEAHVIYTDTGKFSLSAGIHLERIVVEQSAILRLEPGDHFFCDGIEVKDDASLLGDDVALLFEGGALIAQDQARLSLTGRSSGQWAGFLVAADFTNQSDMMIASPNVDKLLGAIYLSNSNLEIDSAGSVAEDSKWSVVVAQNVHLVGNSRLVINANYAGSGVPVPVGIGNNSGPQQVGARLKQ